MALTDDQTAFFRRKLGKSVDLTDVELRLTRLGGNERAVVVEVLEERLNTLVSSPASFVVPGEYSQDTRENIKATQAALADAQAELVAGSDLDGSEVFVQEPYYRTSATYLDTEEMFARGYARRTGGR